MRSRSWGLIAAAGLIIGAVLLGISLIGQSTPREALLLVDAATEAVEETPSPSPTLTPIPSKPVTYTVQPGDTLSAIAQELETSVEALVEVNNLVNPDVLQVGQVLVIPQNENAMPPGPGEPTVSTTLVPDEGLWVPPTLTPSGPARMMISEVTAAGDLGAESVTLRNEGGAVSLEGWTIVRQPDDAFTFPGLTLFPQGAVRIHSKEGEDTPRHLYWGRLEPAWQKGGLVTLRDRDGNVVDTYIVPE